MGHLATVAIAGLSLAVACTAAAQEDSWGKSEFMNSCAQCHGTEGKGDGVISGFLTTPAADLTTLQASNGGVFPFDRVYRVIEGSAAEGAHGTSQMPAWGQRYAAQAPDAQGGGFFVLDQKAMVRARILALVEYVSALQEN